MKEADAVRLDNWFPEQTTVRVRRGHASHATGLVTDVESLMSWNGPSTSKLFAAANNKVFDITTSGAVGAADFSGTVSNRWQHTMFGTGAGNYLYVVNGSDDPRYYDGSSWTTPTITGTGLNPSDFIHVNAYKRRLFFVERDSLSFWYLAVVSIAGTATKFDLSPVCSLGGHLVAMGTWTRDGGDGVDDYAVFLTSMGEVIIYQGDDPGSASAWSLVGVFRIGPPIGRRCLIKIGGDLVVVTEDGFSQLSRFLAAARASDRAAMSDQITGAVQESVRNHKTRFGWQPVFYPAGDMVLFNIPTGAQAVQYVSNSTTGAWCRFTGLDANCWEVHNDELYFGGTGTVFQADTGLDDAGADIEADAQTAFSYFGDRGRKKRYAMVRPNLTVDGVLSVAQSISIDFGRDTPESEPTFTAIIGADWDTADWDSADWGIGVRPSLEWQAVVGEGHAAAYRLKVSARNGTIRWNATDWLVEPGGLL